MSSRKIQPTKRGATLDNVTPMMRMFVQYLLCDPQFNASAAAKRAGYKNPALQAQKLLTDKRVQAVLGKELEERIKRCRLDADSVLEHLRVALFLDPLDMFEPGDNGTWRVRSLDEIPQEVRRCITKIKQRQRTIGEATETYIELELMSKDAALQAAMKHLMLLAPDMHQTNVNIGGDLNLDLTALVEQVEAEHNNVVDARAIKRIAKE